VEASLLSSSEASNQRCIALISIAVRPTPDGGYVAAGYLALPDTGTQDSWVIKVDSNGCLTPNCLVTGLPQIRRQNHLEVTVYPNPTSGTIHLELPQRMAMYRIVVLSLNGKQLNAVNTTYQKNVTLQLDQASRSLFRAGVGKRPIDL
jgi:hypothetical protein